MNIYGKATRAWAARLGVATRISLVASIMLVVLGGLQASRSYDDALTDSSKERRDLTRSLAQHADLSLDAVDLVLSGITEGLANPNLAEFQGYLDRRTRRLDQVQGIVASKDGRRWVSPTASVDDAAWPEDDQALAWHRKHPENTDLHLDLLFGEQFKQRVAIVLSRGVRDGSGAVNGVVAATLSTKFFETFYATMEKGAHGAINLWRDDGRMLIRSPPSLEDVGRDLSHAQITSEVARAPFGLYVGSNSIVDGTDRLVAYQRLSRHPHLVIFASQRMDDVLRTWRESVFSLLATGSLAVVALLTLGMGFDRHRHRLEETQRVQRDAETLFRGVFQHATDRLVVCRIVADDKVVVEALNEAALAMIDRQAADVIDQPVQTVLPPTIAARILTDFRGVNAKRSVVRFEDENESDGQKRWFEVVLVPIMGGADTIERILAGARDITDRKRTEIDLRATNTRLALSERIAHVGNWRIDLPSGAIFWSEETYRIHGFDLGQHPPSMKKAIGQYHRDDQKTLWRLPNLARTNPSGVQSTLRLFRPDGAMRVVITRCLVEMDASGTVVAILGTIMDVTEMHEAQSELAAKTALLETTLSHMEQGLLMLDDQKRIVVCNTRASALLDKPSLPLGAKPISIDGNSSSLLRDLADAFLGEPSAKTMIATDRVLEVRTVPVPRGGAVVTYTDITELKQAEQRIRESEARYRLLAENTSELILLGHDDGRRSYTSPAVERLLGFTAAEFEALRLRDYVHPDDLARLYATTARLSTGQPEVSLTYRALHKTKGWVWVEGVFRRIADAPGGEPSIVATFRDVGERIRHAEALRQAKEGAETAQAEAERASVAKTEFLASMSHEIRTPLSGVLGYTDLLLDDVGLTGSQRRHAERIQNAGTALLTVVNDILDFSKIEAGQIDLDLRAFNLEILVDNTVSIVRGVAERKRLELIVTMDDTLPRDVVGDEDRLRQVLLNLLNNAIKFTPAGRVTLHVGREATVSKQDRSETAVRFSIIDTGIGIPLAKQAHLFARFSQVDGSVRREFGGTGLGLAISKNLATLMGGAIGVVSAPTRGSTFWFTVSLAPAEGLDALEAIDARADRVCRPAFLLLVDDIEINRELAQAVLLAGGHSVDLAADGAEAIMAVQAKTYDAVLMDVQMPGMDGIAATAHIRSLPAPLRDIPIIAMTANVLPDQIAQCRRAGMNDHVGKPIKREALFAAISRALNGEGAVAGTLLPDPGPAVLDQAVYDDLREMLGEDSLAMLLAKLANHLREEFGTPLLRSPDASQLGRESHKVISMAGMLGFMELSALCADLERACLDGGDLDALIPKVDQAREGAIARIATLQAA